MLLLSIFFYSPHNQFFSSGRTLSPFFFAVLIDYGREKVAPGKNGKTVISTEIFVKSKKKSGKDRVESQNKTRKGSLKYLQTGKKNGVVSV